MSCFLILRKASVVSELNSTHPRPSASYHFSNTASTGSSLRHVPPLMPSRSLDWPWRPLRDQGTRPGRAEPTSLASRPTIRYPGKVCYTAVRDG